MDRSKYPDDWEQVSLAIRARAGGRCEWPGCEARHGQPHPITGSHVILTVAHLNHEPMDCRPENLRALCQRCHLNYDRPRHIMAARIRRRSRLACGDLFLGQYRIGLTG
jgi:5-methylcytosine-specific restriction endonuclease McrA